MDDKGKVIYIKCIEERYKKWPRRKGRITDTNATISDSAKYWKLRYLENLSPLQMCNQIVLNMADCQVENLNTLQMLLHLNKIGQVKFANIVSNYDIRIHFTYEILQIISK